MLRGPAPPPSSWLVYRDQTLKRVTSVPLEDRQTQHRTLNLVVNGSSLWASLGSGGMAPHYVAAGRWFQFPTRLPPTAPHPTYYCMGVEVPVPSGVYSLGREEPLCLAFSDTTPRDTGASSVLGGRSAGIRAPHWHGWRVTGRSLNTF